MTSSLSHYQTLILLSVFYSSICQHSTVQEKWPFTVLLKEGCRLPLGNHPNPLVESASKAQRCARWKKAKLLRTTGISVLAALCGVCTVCCGKPLWSVVLKTLSVEIKLHACLFPVLNSNILVLLDIIRICLSSLWGSCLCSSGCGFLSVFSISLRRWALSQKVSILPEVL